MQGLRNNRFLIFIRHSAVEINKDRSSHDWTLTDEGRARCKPLAENLASYRPSQLISSEEPKAVETARVMSKTLGVPHRTAPGFQEHNRSQTPYFDSIQEFQSAVQQFFANPEKLVFGQETAVEALKRFNEAVFREINLSNNGTLAFVTHGTVLTLFVCHYNPQLDPMTFWSSLRMPCAVILNFQEISLEACLE